MPSREYYQRNPEKYRSEANDYYTAHRTSCIDKMKARHAANPIPGRTRAIKWAKDHPVEHVRHGVNTRRKKNGFSIELFASRMTEQDGKCPICGVVLTTGLGATTACADHCHNTKTPRGVLCKRCNTLLGWAKDDVRVLLKAAEYLNFWCATT